MPMICVDCLLVMMIHVAANVEAVTKILKQIWAPRKAFWNFGGGFVSNLDSMMDMFGLEEKEA